MEGKIPAHGRSFRRNWSANKTAMDVSCFLSFVHIAARIWVRFNFCVPTQKHTNIDEQHDTFLIFNLTDIWRTVFGGRYIIIFILHHKWWFGANAKTNGGCFTTILILILFWKRCWCWWWNIRGGGVRDRFTYRYHIHPIKTSPPFLYGWCLCATPRTIPLLVFHF